jgi:hypothetical protein
MPTNVLPRFSDVPNPTRLSYMLVFTPTAGHCSNGKYRKMEPTPSIVFHAARPPPQFSPHRMLPRHHFLIFPLSPSLSLSSSLSWLSEGRHGSPRRGSGSTQGRNWVVWSGCRRRCCKLPMQMLRATDAGATRRQCCCCKRHHYCLKLTPWCFQWTARCCQRWGKILPTHGNAAAMVESQCCQGFATINTPMLQRVRRHWSYKG